MGCEDATGNGIGAAVGPCSETAAVGCLSVRRVSREGDGIDGKDGRREVAVSERGQLAAGIANVYGAALSEKTYIKQVNTGVIRVLRGFKI